MLFNYFKIALRNLHKQRFFSSLNILGLALGMSACLTLILIIRDQLGYDKFHPDAERVYRINCQEEEGTRLACAPYPLGATLAKEYGAVETSTRLIRGIYGLDATTADNRTFQVGGYFAEPSFFEVFGFQLEVGNAATALSEPNGLVLSKKAAARLFPNQNPIGASLVLKDKGTYKVTGVVAEPPGKSHIMFECLLAAASMPAIEAALPTEMAGEKVLENWENHYMSHVYVRLRPGKTSTDLQNDLDLVAEARAKVGMGDKGVTFFAQHLNNITPQPERLANDTTNGAPIFFFWGMLFFLVLLTVFPCLNYANLAISAALARTREMGVRKAIGASQLELRKLFLAESVLTAFLALALAWLLHLPINRFVGIYFPPEADLQTLSAKPTDWAIFVLFAAVVGLLAGWIPARRMSKMQALSALRSNAQGTATTGKRMGWRTAMIVGQFAFSLILMVIVATLWGQMRYMAMSNYGFQKENLLTVELQGNSADIVGREMLQSPTVVGVAPASVPLAGNSLQRTGIKRKPGSDYEDLHSVYVNGGYMRVMGIQLLAGKDFPEGKPVEGHEELLILNEKAVQHFGLGTPNEAVDQTIWLGDSLPARVCGVVRDFHYRTFEAHIEPFGLVYGAPDKHLLQVRIAPGDPARTMAALTGIWKKLDSVHEFKAKFTDDALDGSAGGVRLVSGLVGFFAVLSLALACMALLGMVTYSVGTKVKEIGVRKVLGASVASVAVQLSKRFVLALAVAVCIALPLGYLVSNLFLGLFAYHISVGASILGGSAVVLLALGLFTVGVQAWKAALANPTDSLRSE
jgi:putative ABC transport system permease protein